METQPLSSDEVRSFHARGYLRCDDFFDRDEHARLREWVGELSQMDESSGLVHYQEMTDNGPVLARTEQFLASHEGLREVLTGGRPIHAMHQLFGEPASVFKEKVNYKRPGGGGFHPHQDAAAYHRFGSLHITCLIAVDPNTEANGCLCLAPGEHAQGLLAVNDVGCLPAETAAGMTWEAAPVMPGGVLFFSSFAPHQSAPNHSAESRGSLYVTYGKASEGNLRDAYYQDRSNVLRDHQPTEHDANRISTIGHFQGKTVQ